MPGGRYSGAGVRFREIPVRIRQCQNPSVLRTGSRVTLRPWKGGVSSPQRVLVGTQGAATTYEPLPGGIRGDRVYKHLATHKARRKNALNWTCGSSTRLCSTTSKEVGLGQILPDFRHVQHWDFRDCS